MCPGGGIKGEFRHFLALGRMVGEPQQLYASYESACQSASSLSYKGFSSCAFSEEVAQDRHFELDREREEAFVNALSRRDKEEAGRILKDIYDDLTDQKAALNSSVKNMYFLLYNHVLRLERSC